MTKDYLQNSITESHQLNIINKQIENWDYKEVNGKGLFKKYTGHYAYIELSITPSVEDFRRNWVIWNVKEKQLPVQLGHKPVVEKVLSFFIDYLSAIKGKRIQLTIEIKDGCYHPVDTKARDFETATIYALINAFDKKARVIGLDDFEFIEKLKLDAIAKQSKNK
ncbi:hypothetical protein [Flagellimonas aequoris]|uniref:Uncharacterized protein n=1 Tax=Flagellimonas aequoris TaxID=2306997 RepID=A0A418N329_9FLAO|nr:hypothetical protein [Allomuricauda aequoris]RIV68260.1 hypothetical protein D2U88_13590 [Allomuricauda aequoris]TXJ99949.1 hypothetical protein FQ019_13440 [Allomuricauda aequoris]